jgi:hypothetical protein
VTANVPNGSKTTRDDAPWQYTTLHAPEVADALGIPATQLAGDPLLATACVVAADLIAAGMMVPKTWRDPGSETLSTFAWASLAGALSAAAVGALEPSLLLYPVYYCLVNGGLALLIGVRRVMRSVIVVVVGVPR